MILGLAPGAGADIATLADLDAYLGAVADAGFDAVSLGLQQLPDGGLEGAARLLDRHGLRCTDVISLRVSRDDEATLTDARALRPVVETLGAATVLTMLWTRPTPESYDRLARCAEAIGVPLALEFGPAPCPTVAAAAEVVEAIGADRVTVLADAFHLFRGGSTLAMVEALAPEQLSIVQWTDALPAVSDDYMAETTQRRAFAGEGELDLSALAATLRTIGWDGVVSVEVLSAELRRLPLAEFARRAHDTTVASLT